MNPTLKPKLAFALLLVLSGFIAVQMVLFAADQIFPMELPNWNLFQYCLSAINGHAAGYSITKLLLYAMIGYTAGRIAMRLVIHFHLSRKWSRDFRSARHVPLTRRLNYTYKDWSTRIVVIRDDAFIAMTMGLIRPTIIISSGLLKMFSERETEAILLHELHHCRTYDPLKLFIVTLILDGMGYVPIIRALVRYYKTWSELAADRFAMEQMGSVYELGNVLLRLSQGTRVRNRPVGAYFADSAINYRIMQVLEPDRPVRVPFWRLQPVVSSLIIMIFIGSLVMGGCT